jgi:hypothetical protein
MGNLIELEEETKEEVETAIQEYEHINESVNDSFIDKTDRSMSYLSTQESKIIVDEEKEEIKSDSKLYFHFLLSNHKWIIILFISFPFNALTQYLQMRIFEMIGDWVKDQNLGEDFFYVWGLFVVSTILG